ncbi:uncharacterized protein LODBEIA_P31670 [Lodderomyces beijingensis]|uniref:Lysophospholipase n=1 Tax=Lodderomyces beijingensis TaxID=1775926 RepID=A0ABP0ZMQ4_9ASCO
MKSPHLLQLILLASTLTIVNAEETQNTVGATPTQTPWWLQILQAATSTLSSSSSSSSSPSPTPSQKTSLSSNTASSTSEPWYQNLFGTAASTLSMPQTTATSSRAPAPVSTQTSTATSQAASAASAVSTQLSTDILSFASAVSSRASSAASSGSTHIASAAAVGSSRISSAVSAVSSDLQHLNATLSSVPHSTTTQQNSSSATTVDFLSSLLSDLGISGGGGSGGGGGLNTAKSPSSLNSTGASTMGSGSSSSAASTAQTTDETESNNDGDGVSNPYSPVNVTCPNHSIVREADGLSELEEDYVWSKQVLTNKHLVDFLANRVNMSDFDADSFINDNAHEHNITIGLAFSGGGYRAMLAGAGSILALDDRLADSNTNGLGGLLQSTTYISGLSGGSWLVGSLVLNNWISVQDVLNGSAKIWQLEDSLLNPSSMNLASLAKYYTGIGTSIVAKNEAGFETSVTDLWGRALSHQFFDDESGGSNVTWSSVRNFTSFKDHSMPYFFAVANGQVYDDSAVDSNSTFIVEISAYEFGNFDNSLRSFVDTEYLGSSIEDGNADQCVRNFDNGGFIMGTSSSLFNQVFLHLSDYDAGVLLEPVLESVLQDLSDDNDDVAIYEPNPFYQSTYGSIKSVGNNHTLSLIDGGEDAQNVPFYPLIRKERGVDVVFAFDNSADTGENWPNGTCAEATYKWQFTDQGKGTPFPFVPNVSTFLDQSLGDKPIFFGCNASSLTDLVKWHDDDKLNETDVPLVVYISNNHQSYLSNFSTFKLAYDNAEKAGTIKNGYEVMTSKNFTEDSEWGVCVGCAIIRRQQERLGQEQSQECQKCFREYCWMGGLEDGPQIDAAGLGLTDSHRNSTNSSSNSTSSGGQNSTTSGQGNSSHSGSSSTTSSTSSSSSSSSSSSRTSTKNTAYFTRPSVLMALLNSLMTLVFAYL